jgi:hypothetical protein
MFTQPNNSGGFSRAISVPARERSAKQERALARHFRINGTPSRNDLGRISIAKGMFPKVSAEGFDRVLREARTNKSSK